MGRQNGHHFEFGEFRLEPEKLRLWHGEQQVQMRPKAVEILLLLLRNPGRTVLRDEILESVWKDTFVEEGNINFNVSLIRKALAAGAWETGAPIVTVPKSGYRFVAEVREVGPEPVEARANGDVARPVDPASTARAGVRWHFLAIAAGAVLLLTSFAIWTRVGSGGEAKTPSIAGRSFQSLAVLPLRSIGDDPETRLVGLGISDQLISKLGSSGGFVVRPFSAVEKFEQSDSEAVDFGRQLKVDAVLEGSVQSSGERLRITTRLFDARDGTLLWSDSFEDSSEQVFSVQDRLAESVASALRISLGGERSARYPVNREAYESYLRGRYFFDKRDIDGFKKARAEFEKAISVDPNFALAYSGLSDVYMLQTEHESSRDESFRNARINARKALDLDETLAEAHTSLAWVYRIQDWNWDAAERHFKRAIELNPNYLNARQWYALQLTTRGRFDDALSQIEKAREIDPLSTSVITNYAAILGYTRDNAKIRAFAEYRASVTPKESDRFRDLSLALERAGDIDEAFRLAEQLKAINGGRTSSQSLDARLAVHYARGGRTDESTAIFRGLEQKVSEDTYAAYLLAMAYADLGRNDEAIRMLELCFRGHDPRMVWINVEPRFDALRTDQRFVKIVNAMGFG